MENTATKTLKGLAKILAGAVIAGSFLGGCSGNGDYEVENLKSFVGKKVEGREVVPARQLDWAIRFYETVDQKDPNYTKYLAAPDKNFRDYAESCPWMNADKLTPRDKMYIGKVVDSLPSFNF